MTRGTTFVTRCKDEIGTNTLSFFTAQYLLSLKISMKILDSYVVQCMCGFTLCFGTNEYIIWNLYCNMNIERKNGESKE